MGTTQGLMAEAEVTLRLASSSDGPALAIRDHLVPLVRERGTLEVQSDTVRLIVLRAGELTIEHWTPFNDPSLTDAASPGYRHALAQQHSVPDLPYGLDVWHAHRRMLRLLWADTGAFKVVDFVRGPWEAEALGL
jgi:hypothetical protein